MGPIGPVAPAIPWVPVAPLGPLTPVGPVAPIGPVAPLDPESLAASAALRVEAADGAVTIHQCRTGERRRFAVSVETSSDVPAGAAAAPHSPASVTARVATTPPLELMLPEMTERQQTVIETGVRQWLIAVAFGEDAIVSRHTPAELLPRAVTSAVRALTRDHAPSLTTRLVALLDLLELERLHVPFDAQTLFYETFLARGEGEASTLDPALKAIAARLGFSMI